MDARRIDVITASRFNLTPTERRQVDALVAMLPPLTPRQLGVLIEALSLIRSRAER